MTETTPVETGDTTVAAVEWLPQKLSYGIVIGTALFGIAWGLVNTLIVRKD